MKIINLLPKNKQKELKFEKLYYSLQRFALVAVISVILVVTAQIGTKVYLKWQLSKLTAEIAIIKSNENKEENAKIKTKIKQINNQISDFATLTATSPAWSEVLSALAPLVPSEVTIQTFSADEAKKQVLISGYSKTREGVVGLYNKILNANGKFKNIDYPLENVSKPEDVPFHFTFQIEDTLLFPENKK